MSGRGPEREIDESFHLLVTSPITHVDLRKYKVKREGGLPIAIVNCGDYTPTRPMIGFTRKKSLGNLL